MQPVTIAYVVSEFALAERICYAVVLSCGCKFWEYRPIGVAPPRRGALAACSADHTEDHELFRYSATRTAK